MSDYIIPAGYGEAEYIDKKSRFIGQVQHAESEAEAMAFVEQIRKKHADATHNVWAYVLNSGAMRWSDDGEPGGTSGQPTLNVFRSAGVVDVCCVVTRYFGGILLGSGGLEGHGRGLGVGAHRLRLRPVRARQAPARRPRRRGPRLQLRRGRLRERAPARGHGPALLRPAHRRHRGQRQGAHIRQRFQAAENFFGKIEGFCGERSIRIV